MILERFDVIIFGATGYTGKYAVQIGVKLFKEFSKTWAIAGRNHEKMKNTLTEIGMKMNEDLSNVPIIVADVKDEKSLSDMTKRAKILLNLVGPYRFYGEPVIKACAETACHHVDVSGEPQYMEEMQLKYDKVAREKGIYIVSACGFDSIIGDIGTLYLQQMFKGTVNSVESYLRGYFINGYKPVGAGVHFTTYESAVHGFAHANELKSIRKQLFPQRLPVFKPSLEEKPRLYKAEDFNNHWSLSVPTADHSVIMRSQRYFFEKENQRPVHLKTYNTFESYSNALKVVMAGKVFNYLTKTSWGKNLLLTYPKLFSFGFASHEGPSEERNRNTNFETIFVGKGWREVFPVPTKDIEIPQNKKVVTRVTCNNPLYGAASTALLLSAITILDEPEKLPENGGVLSPAAAFRNTSLINKLQDNGFVFEVLKVEELKSKL